MSEPTQILYHDGCVDGFTAWWIAKRALPHAIGTPCQYGRPIAVEDGANLIFLDFSPSREVLLDLITRHEVEVHDHHKTAQAALAGLDCATFDMHKSGARLAWERFRSDEPYDFVLYVEDRDLWTWNMHKSREVSAAIRSYPMTLETWDVIANRHIDNLKQDGEAILRYQAQIVDRHVRNAKPAMVGGHTVPLVNATCLESEIGEALAKGQPFAATWFAISDGSKVYSLRSDESGLDVSEIAKANGGGGHAHAAGFKVAP